MLHQNIQCLRNKTEEIELFINTLENQPDIICITEHWLKKEEEEITKINGYAMAASFSRDSMEHGGVCIYGKKGFSCEEIHGIKEKSIEGQIECVGVRNKELKIIALCVYRTGLGEFNLFIEKMDEIIGIIEVNFKQYKIILCGYFNVDLLKYNRESKVLLDLINTHNLIQTITEPTRVTKRNASLLDNIFVNFNEFSDNNIVASALSDHHAQTLCLNIGVTKVEKRNDWTRKRIFSAGKMRMFRQELKKVSWERVMTSSDSNIAYEIFINEFKNIMNRIFVKKKISLKTNGQKSWITAGIKISSKRKRFLYEEQKAGRINKEVYNQYAGVFKRVVIQAKKLTNLHYINNSENKTKATWSLIRNISNREPKDNSKSIIDHFNSKINSSVILDEINEYFLNACPDTNKNIEGDFGKISSCTSSLFLTPTNMEEVCKHIKLLKNKKSVGQDEIPIKLLKEVTDIIAQPLTHVINLIFDTGVFPDELKIALIKAIHKKGEVDDFKNYRPVSLLSNISKIIEKILYERLSNFLDKNKILHDSQNGFRKGRGTTRAIYQALVKILKSLNNNKETVTMGLDLSKAFDSVDHQILCEKLALYGIRGVPLKLIESYLTNRKQCVAEVGKNGEIIKSKMAVLRKGVPQGSILGPLLYILYTNELPKVVEKTMVLYADDTSLIFSEESSEDCRMIISDTVNTMNDWFEANNLLLNVEKTQLIKFENRSNNGIFTANIGDTQIQSAETLLFLGVYIDKKLNWKPHIDNLAKNMAKQCYALKTIAKEVNTKAALIAYHAYFQSKIRYGLIFWGNSVEVDRILIMQKRCIRGIFKMSQRESCRNIFIKEQIFTIISLYIYEAVVFILDNKEVFSECTKNFKYNTRNKKDLMADGSKYTYIQKNVHFSIIKIWNKLPSEFRVLPKRILKNKLKTYLLNKPYYTIQEFFNENELRL